MRTDQQICILLPNHQVLCAVPPKMKLPELHAALKNEPAVLSGNKKEITSAQDEELMFYLSISG